MKYVYRVSRYSDEIKQCEVVKETEKTITIKEVSYNGMVYESRESRESSGHKFFNTWEEARDALIERYTRNIESLRARLEREKGRLGNARGMKKPEEAL